MISVSDNQFQAMINEAAARLPEPHKSQITNVALLYADQPSAEQEDKIGLRQDQLLLGLYEGVPLTQRQGMQPHLPDKITLFKDALQLLSTDQNDLQQRIYHTLWHEVAHYYGLDHPAIHALE
jgi:predicted Zn-dependent protease with MMP-like domain